MIMNEAAVLAEINESDIEDKYYIAEILLEEADPNFAKRFNRTCKTLKKLLDDVRKHFPDAEYYTASGGLTLMLGKPHSDNEDPQQELIALSARHIGLQIGDGDF